jgi:hypothetical protein
MGRSESKDTIELQDPTWASNGFVEAEANELWSRLPILLREIAVAEIKASNRPTCILENKRGAIVLLEFETGPLLSLPEGSPIRVHTEHEYGNYCYEGTNATYQDPASGCFLAFKAPMATS